MFSLISLELSFRELSLRFLLLRWVRIGGEGFVGFCGTLRTLSASCCSIADHTNAVVMFLALEYKNIEFLAGFPTGTAIGLTGLFVLRHFLSFFNNYSKSTLYLNINMLHYDHQVSNIITMIMSKS